MYQKHTGIILKKHPLGEADELLTIYTQDVGKMRVKAVSSRKIKSRLAGNLQSLNEIEFETAGKNLPILISVRARTINNYLRKDLKKFASALVGVETLYRLTPDRQGNPRAYEVLVDFLKALGETNREDVAVRAFQVSLLDCSGYAIPIEKCVNCNMSLTLDRDTPFFSSISGGFFCQNCDAQKKSNVKLTRDDLKTLQSFLKDTASVEDLSHAVGTVIDEFINYVLEREIKSRDFLQTLNN